MISTNKLMSVLAIVLGLINTVPMVAMRPESAAAAAAVPHGKDDEKEPDERLSSAERTELDNKMFGMAMLATEAVATSLTHMHLPREELAVEAGRALNKGSKLLLAIVKKEKLADAWSGAQGSLNYLVGMEQSRAIIPQCDTNIALNTVLQVLTQTKIDHVTKSISQQLLEGIDGDESVTRFMISFLTQNKEKPWRRNVVKELQKSLRAVDICAGEKLVLNRVHALINAGADCNVVIGEEKVTPLLLAVGNGDASLVELLLEKKACTDLAGSNGKTPLMEAVQAGHADIVTTLILVGGANPDLKDVDGRSARDMARENEDMQEVLESACALRQEMQMQQESVSEQSQESAQAQKESPRE